MENLTEPSTFAFFGLALIALLIAFIARIRREPRIPAARMTWVASGVGAIALLCCGTLVPVSVLDGLLSGTNVISLVRNVFAIAGFWLLLQAVSGKKTTRPIRPLTRTLSVGAITLGIPFFLIERGTTADDFMYERADQIPTFFYAAAYLMIVAGICVRLCWKVWENRSMAFSALFFGSAAVVVGSAAALVAIASICFSWLPLESSTAIYAFSNACFSGGVVCIAGNMAGVALLRLHSSRRVKRSIESVEEIMTSNGLPIPERVLVPALSGAAGTADIQHLYNDVIVVNDFIQRERQGLSTAELQQVTAASHLVSSKMFPERPRPIRYAKVYRQITKWAVS